MPSVNVSYLASDFRTTIGRLAGATSLFLILLFSTTPLRADGEMMVAVSIPPQAWLVETIGGEHVDVEVMLPAGATPETYEPKPRQMQRLGRAEIYFTIGAPFEKGWMPRFRAANDEMRVIDTIERISRRPMVEHDHESDHDHDAPKGGVDPHVWLAPPLVRLQAQVIRDALVTADPDNASAYQAGFNAAAAEISAVDNEILEALAEVPAERRHFMVFHPAFGYFAEAYGLEQMSIEIEGKEPGPRELRRVIEQARDREIAVVFVEPQFAQDAARTLADEIGAEVDTLDPLERDWPAGMRGVARTLETALGDDGGTGRQ
ncbi:MAG: metal ABC transporter solute-binding protein, Zn/Mn family [Guyparkeria sp.]|uniref:metal ABC transporter solute-binding protein, Zn/Mn family n=1 Tax=Guyparkeria sp. TaxID=2035736 RepID=UPI003979F836